MIRITAVAAMLLITTLAVAGPTPEQKCESAKNKFVGIYALCLQKAAAKSIKKDEPTDISKCVIIFDKQWNKAEAKWSESECPTWGDGAVVKADVESCMGDVSLSLSCSVALGGACWYLGLPGESCDDTCAAVGLAYDSATSSFAAASAENCNGVMDALGDTSIPWVGGPLPCVLAGGCYASGGGDRVLCGASSDAAIAGAERACACQ